jgi:hypothetical protein
MILNRFRIAAAALIGFNVLGTIVSWLAHLQKPTIGDAHAFASGTQFTGPILLMIIGMGAYALTFSSRRWIASTGIGLLGLWGAGFAVGEVGELFSHNVGISSGRWDVVLVGALLGALIGIRTAILAGAQLAAQRGRYRLEVAR